MIGSFPDLYPDELLYSGMARYEDWMAYWSKGALLCELYGKPTVIPGFACPNRLDYLSAALPPGHHYTADVLMDRHTLLPVYAPFLTPERLARVREYMRSDTGRQAIYALTGVGPGAMSPVKELQFCPVCVEQDRQQYGETYWHRLHHVPGVLVCPKHQAWLETTHTSYITVGTRHVFVSAERIIAPTKARELDLSRPDHRTLVAIAQDIAWLLNQPVLKPSLAELHERYRACLVEQNLQTYAGYLRLSPLMEAFRAAYSPELLEILGCNLNPQLRIDWPINLLRNRGKTLAPVRYILVARLLGHTLESLLSLSPELKPFGDGPWPCLNAAAEHYRQPCISHDQMTWTLSEKGQPLGTFACECGFTYWRGGPDQSPDDRFRYWSIIQTGPIWDALLCEMWHDLTVTRKDIRERLRVGWQVLEKQALRLALPFPRPSLFKPRSPHPIPVFPPPTKPKPLRDPAPYRAIWLDGLERFPEAITSELRTRFSREFDWLQRNDAEWLAAHLPPPRPRAACPSPVDWEERDARLAAKIEVTAQQLKNRAEKPFWVSRNALKKAVREHDRIQHMPDKLPRSIEALAACAETREDFAVRRVWWWADQFRQAGQQPRRYQLAQRAQVRKGSRFGSSPRIQAALDAALATFDEAGYQP
jgi:hypothetical protein